MPPIINSVDEVWGFRCALAPMLLSFTLASDRAPRFVRRKCNIADIGWRKQEPLTEMLIEFCVHGHFYREEGNTNGVYGAWWAPLDLLIDKVGKEDGRARRK